MALPAVALEKDQFSCGLRAMVVDILTHVIATVTQTQSSRSAFQVQPKEGEFYLFVISNSDYVTSISLFCSKLDISRGILRSVHQP
jgi:hypothetical protein